MRLTLAVLYCILSTTSACTKGERGSDHWLVHMPEVERAQAKSPTPLRTSEFWDKRLSVAAESANAEQLFGERPLMDKLRDCRPLAVTMIAGDQNEPQMPVRFELSSRRGDASFAHCVRSALPSGFVLDAIR